MRRAGRASSAPWWSPGESLFVGVTLEEPLRAGKLLGPVNGAGVLEDGSVSDQNRSAPEIMWIRIRRILARVIPDRRGLARIQPDMCLTAQHAGPYIRATLANASNAVLSNCI